MIENVRRRLKVIAIDPKWPSRTDMETGASGAWGSLL
jgi:hypothetical protein